MRKLRIKVFMHLQLHVVETWRQVTDLNMERRRWFHDWKENADRQMKQRNIPQTDLSEWGSDGLVKDPVTANAIRRLVCRSILMRRRGTS